MSRITQLSLLRSAESSPHSSLINEWLADGTHRWQQPLGCAAPAPATGMGCLCGPGASRREGSLSAPAAPRLLRQQLSGAAKNAMASRAKSLPSIHAPHFCTKNSCDGSDCNRCCALLPIPVNDQVRFYLSAAARAAATPSPLPPHHPLPQPALTIPSVGVRSCRPRSWIRSNS